MIVHDPSKNQLKIEIPLTGLDDLSKYQNALLSMLRRVSIDKNDYQFKEDLKTVYSLLSHTLLDKGLLSNKESLEILMEHNGSLYLLKGPKE